jgi:drug/metabolite transporter (DMT)-like permease
VTLRRVTAATEVAAATGVATAQGSGRSWLLPYLGAALIWGCSFLFIKIGLEALSPIHVAFGRQALGAVALLVLVAVTRVRLPRDRGTWAHLFVVALLLNSVPSTLFAFGETHVSSVVAGIINAVTPLATILAMFVAFRSDRPTAGTVAGILLGFAGILVVVGIWNGVGSNEALGVLACLGAVSCYGSASRTSGETWPREASGRSPWPPPRSPSPPCSSCPSRCSIRARSAS